MLPQYGLAPGWFGHTPSTGSTSGVLRYSGLWPVLLGQQGAYPHHRGAGFTVFYSGRISGNVTPNVLPLSTTRGLHFNKFGQNKKQWLACLDQGLVGSDMSVLVICHQRYPAAAQVLSWLVGC